MPDEPRVASPMVGMIERLASVFLIVGLVPVGVLFVVHSLPGPQEPAEAAVPVSAWHELDWRAVGPGACHTDRAAAARAESAETASGGSETGAGLLIEASEYTRCVPSDASAGAWSDYRVRARVAGTTPHASAVVAVRHSAAGRVEVVVGEARVRVQQRTGEGWTVLDEWALPKTRARQVDVVVRDDSIAVSAASEPARSLEIAPELAAGPPSFGVAADSPSRVRFAELALSPAASRDGGVPPLAAGDPSQALALE